ncbi:MAG: ATP-binding cassette domain-containing protein [Bacteroidota bacterium]
MDLIELSPLFKRYKQHVVFDQDSLAFNKGIHVLLGENGSGKSTLLKILAGYSSFVGTGKILGNIRLRKDHQTLCRAVSYAEAEPEFPDHILGKYFVDMFIRLKNGDRKELEEIKDFLGITNFLTQPVGNYSSGMKKKLSLLLAFIGKNRLILLDEPFNTLDPQARTSLCALIQKYSDKGISFIMAMHHQLPQDSLTVSSYWKILDKKVLGLTEPELVSYFSDTPPLPPVN